MALKDWKKDRSAEEFGDHFWSKDRKHIVEIRDTPKRGERCVKITKNFQTLKERKTKRCFRNDSSALKFAKSYMCSH